VVKNLCSFSKSQPTRGRRTVTGQLCLRATAMLHFLSRPNFGQNQRNLYPIMLLACVAVVVDVIDAVTGIQMMSARGASAELNPVVRSIFLLVGPGGVLALKIAAATLVLTAFVYLAWRGRRRLAANAILLAIAMGVLGVLSNI
jgi:hypothetical protein